VDRKKQLLYRISRWGFEKNVKKNERRAIIEHLGPELGRVEFKAQTLRGRTLDAAKLNRWMQLEKVTFEESLVENNEVACVPGKFYFYSDLVYLADIYCEASLVPFERNFRLTNQDSEIRAPSQTPNYEGQSELDLQVQESQSVSVLRYNDYSFDWNSVDVIGSPGLTKLIGALTIEECDIPLLDLASDSLGADDISGSDLMDLCSRCGSAQKENIICRMQSWSTRLSTSIKTSQAFGNFGKSSHFGLQCELYPFPTASSQSYVVYRPQYFSSGFLKPRVSDSECKIKLQKLKYMQDTEIIHLVEVMGARAEELYDQGCYDTAETWFRGVVRAKKLVHWYKPHQTLWACLHVVGCVQLQDRYKEAQQLQQGLHGTIERMLSADHNISVRSRKLNAEILGHLGFMAEEEVVRRQVLQICLTTLGARHLETIDALEDLGCALELLRRHGEARPLLETSLHFWLGTAKNSGDPLISPRILWDVAVLAQAVGSDGRYDESENVLDFTHNLLGDATGWRNHACFDYHYARACTYRLQKRFETSEKIFRGLLKYHLDYMVPGMIIESMGYLAEILVETGRHREAASWRKRDYLFRVKTYGLTHRYTMDCCEDLGFCYAHQSRYSEGKSFFEEVIEILDLSSEESDSRTVCIQIISAWLEQLEEMRVKDSSMEWVSETSGSVDSEGEPIDTDDDVDYEDMSDIPDPLDY
jgi:tetratricopeptide (TPR) repeat protein